MDRLEFNSRAQRARRMLGIALLRPTVGPQVVSLEITHTCNLRCSFCESHGSHQLAPITAKRAYAGERRMMDLETIRRLVQGLVCQHTDLVELSGKGDPNTHPHLPEIIRVIKEAGLGCAVVTNGTLAQPELVSTLIGHRVNCLNVSLNAGSREVYVRSNGRDLWDRATGFLAEVLDLRRGSETALPWVRVSHVLTKENVADMENMVRVCCDLRVDEVAWCVLSELPEIPHLQLDQADVAMIRRRLPEWSEHFAAAGIVHDLPSLIEELSLRIGGQGKPQDNPLQRLLPCYEGWMFCVIQPDGVVLPCCYCEEEHLGNIFDRCFEEIWLGAPYREYRRRSLEMPKTGRWICGECFTSCNRAKENLRIHNRVHPLRKVRAGTAPAAQAPNF